MDRPAARTEAALFGDGRAAGGEQQRHAIPAQVDDVVDGVGGADIDVHHHGLGPAGHQVGAMRHGDREVLVRHQYRSRHLGVRVAGPAEGFDDRRKVGARIGEEEIDAMLGERPQEDLAGNGCARGGLSVRQGILPGRS